MDHPASDLISPVIWQRIEYHTRTARVARFVGHQSGRRITLAEAAEIACMERTAFSRYFKDRVGVSFSRFLRAYRIGLAIELMRHQDLSISEIAHGAGFHCLITFERSFRKELSVNPSIFRLRLLSRSGTRANESA